MFVKIFIFFAALGISFAQNLPSVEDSAMARVLFGNPNIKTSYSELMREKNSKADSLLPALDGDKAFSELTSATPDLWSIKELQKGKSLNTKLNVNVIYIDGIKEEAFCDFSKTINAENWDVAIGVDFVSGSSNTAGVHVKQCMDWVQDSIGYAVTDSSGKTVIVPPRKILQGFKKNNAPDTFPLDLYMKLIKTNRSIVDGECLDDMETYAIIVDVLKQIENPPVVSSGDAPSFWTKRNIFSIVAIALSVTSTSLGLWQDSQVASDGKKTSGLYIEASAAKDGTDYPKKYFAYRKNVNDISRSENLRNGFYISAGVFGLAGIVTFFF